MSKPNNKMLGLFFYTYFYPYTFGSDLGEWLCLICMRLLKN